MFGRRTRRDAVDRPGHRAGVAAAIRGRPKVVALVGVVALLALAGVAAALFVGSGGGDGPPEADLSVEVTATDITVEHDGGDTLATDEIAVTVVADGDRTERVLSAFDDRPDDADSFEPGDAFGHSDSYAGDVTVFVVHEPTDTRLVDTTRSVDADTELTLESVESEAGELFVGEEVTATFALDNQGGPEDQHVAVRFDGETVFDGTVTVAPGTATTETVTGEADLSDGLDVEVETDHEVVAETYAAPLFDVEFTVDTGNPSVDIAYTVENTGDIGAERSVAFESAGPDGAVVDEGETSERVAAGASVEGTFADVTVESGGEVSVSSPDDTASTTLGESDFQVVGFDAPDEVGAGEEIAVAYEIENAGESVDSQAVTFLVDGEMEESESFALGAGDTASGEFAYATDADDTPETTVGVATDDDSASAAVAVDAAAGPFLVDIAGTNAPVTEGESLAVTATVENAGDEADTREVELDVPGLGTNATEVTLSGGASAEVTLSVVAASTGTYEATVASDTDADTVGATVEAAPAEAVFEIVAFDAPAEVDAGSDIDVTYEVANTGDATATQDVVFEVDGEEAATVPVTLDPGESHDDTFSYTEATETVAVGVSTDDDSESATVTVSEPPSDGDVVASLDAVEGSVGETVAVDLDVVGVGGQGGTFGSYTVIIAYDESVLDFAGVQAGTWGAPASQNDEDGAVAVADFDADGETPADPALTLEFEIVGEGTSALVFDDNAAGIPGENTINDGDGDAYDVVFEDGSVDS